MEPVLSKFLMAGLADPAAAWTDSHISEFAGFQVPDVLFAGRRTLLQHDIANMWSIWFLESLCDPERHLSGASSGGYAFVYDDVRKQVDLLIPDVPLDERRHASQVFARLAWNRIRTRFSRARQRIDLDIRRQLVDASSPDVRCWICGHLFSEIALDRFLDGKQAASNLPLKQFVDCFKPSGLRARDRDIEMDHIVPHAAGGTEEANLALACGWCNRHKGAFSSLYDQALTPNVLHHPIEGRLSVPRPFWIIRLLATRRRCEFAGGCANTSENAELTVMLKNPRGAANPSNLRVTCQDHDEMADMRYIPRRYLAGTL